MSQPGQPHVVPVGQALEVRPRGLRIEQEKQDRAEHTVVARQLPMAEQPVGQVAHLPPIVSVRLRGHSGRPVQQVNDSGTVAFRGRPAGDRQRFAQPVNAVGLAAEHLPVPGQAQGESDRAAVVAAGAQVAQRGERVVVLGADDRHRRQLAGSAQLRVELGD